MPMARPSTHRRVLLPWRVPHVRCTSMMLAPDCSPRGRGSTTSVAEEKRPVPSDQTIHGSVAPNREYPTAYPEKEI